jgi:hypothetical protein
MKKTVFDRLKAGVFRRSLRNDTDGIALVTLFLIILVFVAFFVFVANIANIALGLAVIGISFIIIAAGINAIRNSFSKRRSSYEERSKW